MFTFLFHILIYYMRKVTYVVIISEIILKWIKNQKSQHIYRCFLLKMYYSFHLPLFCDSYERVCLRLKSLSRIGAMIYALFISCNPQIILHFAQLMTSCQKNWLIKSWGYMHFFFPIVRASREYIINSAFKILIQRHNFPVRCLWSKNWGSRLVPLSTFKF